MGKINFSKAGFRHDLKELLLENMSSDQLLDELFHAMSDSEALENCEHIARMYDIDIEDEEDEEEDEEEGDEV